MPPEYPADVAILTVVPEAHEAVIALLGVQTEHRLGQHYTVGNVRAHDGHEHVVVCDRAADRSNQPALEATQRMLRAWRPQLLIVADIGGGIYGMNEADRDGVRLGDVIMANNLEYLSLVKEIEGGREEPRKFPFMPPSKGPRVSLNLLATTDDSWLADITVPRPTGDGTRPALREGEILVGERLLSDPDSQTVARLLRQYPKAIGIDMESVGAATAVFGLQQEAVYAQFAVLRGVSDFIDREGNQDTRDAWKRYAAYSAVALAFLLIRNLPPLGQTAQTLPASVAEYLVGFRTELAAWIKEMSLQSEEAFPLHMTTAAQRGEVPRDSETAGISALKRSDVLSLLLADRRVVIYGASGAGKTATLADVARQVAGESDPLVVIVDLKKFEPEWGNELATHPIGAALTESLDAMLHASIQEVSVQTLDAVLSQRTVLLLVDGLNEVASETADRMLTALDEYRRRHERIRVLVTDRRPRPFFAEARWRYIALPGVTETDARNIIDNRFGQGTFARLESGEQRMLALPFFLNEALKAGDPRLKSRAVAVEAFLRRAGLNDDDLRNAANVSHAMYSGRRSYLERQELETLTATGLLQKLRDSAIVVDRGDHPGFRHQLIHQFLAAWHIEPDPSLWNSDVLDAVTSDAASLDAVAMTLALIPTLHDRDAFLRIVYDWNWRAALVALRETLGAERHISQGLEVALIAMAAEKRFDPVSGTRARVEGLLALIPSRYAEDMRGLTCHESLLRYVGELNGCGLDETWKRLFLRTRAEGPLTEEELVTITADEPLLGWTVANTVRRFLASDESAAQLRMAYGARARAIPTDRAVRWRVAHALGTWVSQANARFLLRVVDADEYMWCRYGAVRSLVEMAARSRDVSLRDEILSALGGRAATMHPEPLGQLAWAALYLEAEPGWCDAVRPLLLSVRDSQPEGSTERARWERRVQGFDDFARAQQAGTVETEDVRGG